jgi:peptidoglycan/xylan/chitin deacetylase (PgdA/CDA1 family)
VSTLKKLAALVAAILLAASLVLRAAEAPARPLLVSVDDLPIGGGGRHPDPAERRTITEGLLTALARHHIRAVGLVIGGNVKDSSDEGLLDLWLKAGHELGNHSYRHLSYTATDTPTYVADVEKARAALTTLLAVHGQRLRFFRYPFLREGDTEDKLDAMRDYLERSGQRNLPVTIDFEDWSFDEPWTNAARAGDRAAQELVAADYLAAARLAVRHDESEGDRLFGRPLAQILLLHATAVSAAQWDRLFAALEASGHRFATADEVLADPVFAEPARYVGAFGFGLFDRLADDRRRREVTAAVAALLAQQSAAWNRADLAGFCSIYADDAAYLGASGIVHGRPAILERYLKRYGGDHAGMGTLSLEVLETRLAAGPEETLLGSAFPGEVQGLSVVARWRLAYPDKPELSGLTLIVFRPHGESWQIVQDASM